MLGEKMLYQNNKNEIYYFTELDEVNGFIPKEMTKLTDKQLKAYENKPEFGVWNGNEWDIDEEAKLAKQIAEAKQYLAKTDHKFYNGYKPKEGEDLVEIERLRDEARDFIRANK